MTILPMSTERAGPRMGTKGESSGGPRGSGRQGGGSGWIPWVFVGAMGFVVAVNAVMITLAVQTFTGLSVEKPYERGIAYNKVLAAQARQDALGWTVTAELSPGDLGRDAPVGSRAGRLVVTVRDADGAPLDGLDLTARLVRPVEVLDDVPVSFTAAGDGRYVARVELPRPGQWDLKANLAQGDAQFTLIERLFLP